MSGGRHCHCHRRLDLGSVTGHFPIRSPFQPGTRRLRPKQQVASPPSPAGRDHRAVLAGTRPAAGSGPALDATGGVSGSVGGCGQRGDTTHLGSALSLWRACWSDLRAQVVAKSSEAVTPAIRAGHRWLQQGGAL